ncbi:magnesium chelatase subunit D [Aurantiacibacter marinus]|uniref:Magnesium chelatase n=1 Tax=Aurantiacibacter marinus TaxID=874156 RepID=A0A0H0XLG6_9SPHN|nr:magnesium chelatase subunit D [Aurantiacibacter marinus]KLI62821.1 magnesium chelatase [Aurantiacibacter marinus]
MTGAAQPPDGLAEAKLAAQLFILAPRALGGIVLRGGGPARDAVLDMIRDTIPSRRMPPHVDEARLLGGVDIVASLTAGKSVMQSGLLTEAEGGALIAPMAERMTDALAGRLAQAMDSDAGFGLVLLDDGIEADERPPAALTDRIAFACDLSGVTSLDYESRLCPDQVPISAVEPASDETLTALAGVAMALGVDSVRPLIFALTTARAHAALNGRTAVAQEDVQAAARMVLAPRATQIPEQTPEDAESPPPPPPDNPDTPVDSDSSQSTESIPEDLILEAALAAIPPDVLDLIAGTRAGRKAQGGGSGRRAKSKLRGKPLGARPGMPRDGARLAIIDTLRAAVPWQPLRRLEQGRETATGHLQVRKEDLRIRRFEERASTVTVFCVDASGSAAAARLAEAKGAVEMILAQAYVKRSEVALIAFRGNGAELLLPPTRSLTRARRALAGLPGGGGTPLANGLTLARELGGSIQSRGNTPFLVFLTDGSANIAADGTPGRKQAREDAHAGARALAASGLDALVIDIAPRPREDAKTIARIMQARYLPLPFADAKALSNIVIAAQPDAPSNAQPA